MSCFISLHDIFQIKPKSTVDWNNHYMQKLQNYKASSGCGGRYIRAEPESRVNTVTFCQVLGSEAEICGSWSPNYQWLSYWSFYEEPLNFTKCLIAALE